VRFCCLLVLTAIVFCGPTAWAGPPRIRQPELVTRDKTLTLADCLDLALKNQPSIRQAAAQVESRTGRMSQARSELLPSTSITSGKSLAGSRGSTGAAAAVGADQLIYDFGRSRSGLTEADRQLAAGAAALSGARADAILSVKQAYYGLLSSTSLVQVSEENVKAREEHVALAQARLDTGFAPRSDVLKAAAALASARFTLVTAKNYAEQARVGLNEAMGIDVRSDTQIAETAEPEIPVPNLDRAVETALKNRPESRQADEQASAAEAALKAAQTGNLPVISTSVSDRQDFGDGIGDSNSWEWGLNLQWRPFDSGFTRGAITQARAQLVTAQESLYDVRQSISGEAVAARLNLLAAQESLVAAKAEVASAKEDLDSATGRYQSGVGILLEVLDAQAALLTARVDELSARYGLSIARAELEHAIGATTIGGMPK